MAQLTTSLLLATRFYFGFKVKVKYTLLIIDLANKLPNLYRFYSFNILRGMGGFCGADSWWGLHVEFNITMFIPTDL